MVFIPELRADSLRVDAPQILGVYNQEDAGKDPEVLYVARWVAPPPGGAGNPAACHKEIE
jgi:hypothetical protein